MQEIWEMQVQSLGQEDPLEEETETYSSVLACETPWTEEPGRLQSVGSQKIEHNWAAEHIDQQWDLFHYIF